MQFATDNNIILRRLIQCCLLARARLTALTKTRLKPCRQNNDKCQISKSSIVFITNVLIDFIYIYIHSIFFHKQGQLSSIHIYNNNKKKTPELGYCEAQHNIAVAQPLRFVQDSLLSVFFSIFAYCYKICLLYVLLKVFGFVS